MKHVPAIFLLPAFLLAGSVFAQEKPAKPERKTMTFPAGAKTPDATPAPAGAATPKPGEKAPEKLPEKTPATPAVQGAPSVVTSTVPQLPAQIAHAFFTLIQQGDIDSAYAGLTKGSKIATRPEELRQLKAKTKEAVEVFGVVHGYDLVESKPVGQRLVRTTYLSLGHEYPLRWRFYFYKSEDTWRLIDMRVDDKLTGIFDEQEEPKTTDTKP